MKILGRVLFAAAATVAAAVVSIAGCGTTNNYNNGGGTSGPGQSCDRTFDCASGLVCQSNVCLMPAAVSDAGSVDGAPIVPPGPHLGQLNETCQTSHDCEAPLSCMGGSCTIVSYNLTATGKSCTGECNTPADCCEMPPSMYVSLGAWISGGDAGFGTYHYFNNGGQGTRCEDISAYIGDPANCDNASLNTQTYLAAGCFLYKTYCNCAANTWACNANQCAYTAPCSVNTATLNGCPQYTRTGPGLSTVCNLSAGGPTGSCSAGCATPTDCAGKTPLSANHACSAPDAGGANCTCFQSACYFKCTKDIDCAGGYTCDTATNLCKVAGCTTNADCVQSTGNPKAQCAMGACQVACANDGECNPPSSICSAGFCKASGCSSDANCPGSTHRFCVTATPTMFTSAVTN